VCRRGCGFAGADSAGSAGSTGAAGAAIPELCLLLLALLELCWSWQCSRTGASRAGEHEAGRDDGRGHTGDAGLAQSRFGCLVGEAAAALVRRATRHWQRGRESGVDKQRPRAAGPTWWCRRDEAGVVARQGGPAQRGPADDQESEILDGAGVHVVQCVKHGRRSEWEPGQPRTQTFARARSSRPPTPFRGKVCVAVAR
jgi:hypothetical protein